MKYTLSKIIPMPMRSVAKPGLGASPAALSACSALMANVTTKQEEL